MSQLQHDRLLVGRSRSRSCSVSSESDSAESKPSQPDGDGRVNSVRRGKRYLWWFFTWNHPEHPSDKEWLCSLPFRYLRFQYEEGKQGTPHYQGVLCTKSQTTLSALKRSSCIPHLEACLNINAAKAYCGKPEGRLDGPWTVGEGPAHGGKRKRSDLVKLKEILDAGGSINDCYQAHFTSAIRNYRGLYDYKKVSQSCSRSWQTVLYVYTGDAGAGKTQAAIEEARVWGGGTYFLNLEGGMSNKVWWDGYDGQENVIIDEFRCQMMLQDFNKLVDSSPYQVPVKGGMVSMLAKRVWILSNWGTENWYLKAAPRDQPVLRASFQRRLHYVEVFVGKFQGQLDFETYLFLRSQFVVAQRAGEYRININK